MYYYLICNHKILKPDFDSKVTFDIQLHHCLVNELHSEAENITETDNLDSLKIELFKK